MKVEIFVANDDDRPNYPGTAYVFIDGKLHNKMRSGDGYIIETKQDYSTTQAPGLTRKALNAKAAA